MADDPDDFKEAMVDDVLAVYEDEERFIDARVAFHKRAGGSIIQEALTFLPWIGSAFEEDDVGAQAALSDVNREQRASLVIDQIQRRLGFPLDDETKNNIRADIRAMYDRQT